MEKKEEVIRWFESLPVLADVKLGVDRQALLDLAGHHGFGVFIGLMMGARQAFYTQLAALPISNMESAARASVIQGRVQGIDLIRETLLEQFIQPAEGQTDASK